MNVFIDIETIPEQPEAEARKLVADTISAPAAMKVKETIDAWHNGEGKYAGEKDALIDETYRKTSFDGGRGQIISIAWAFDDGDVRSISRGLDQSESEMLRSFFAALKPELRMRPPYFIGHNIGSFDLKFLFQRCVVLGVNPGMDLKQWGRHNTHFYDTMLAWAGWGGKVSADALCRALSIPGKPGDIDGSKVWDFVKAGNVARVEEYNADDVTRVRLIYRRMTFAQDMGAPILQVA